MLCLMLIGSVGDSSGEGVEREFNNRVRKSGISVLVRSNSGLRVEVKQIRYDWYINEAYLLKGVCGL